jgi:FkbM family methyltransferase
MIRRLRFQTWMHTLAEGLAFLTNCRARRRSDSFRLCVNRAVFAGQVLRARLTASPPPPGTAWTMFPFRLTNIMRWSSALPGWYILADEASAFGMEKLRREPEWLLLNRLTMGAVLLDIGAHQGRYALAARSRIGPAGRVIAVESHPHNADLLRRNLAENGMHTSVVVNAACWSADQPLFLHADPMSSHSSVSVQPTSQPTPVQMLVPGMKVDTLVARMALPRLDAIKLDVEGSELDVLIGAEATLSAFCPCLFIEFHHTLAKLHPWLQARGYQITHIAYDRGYHQTQRDLGWLLAVPH